MNVDEEPKTDRRTLKLDILSALLVATRSGRIEWRIEESPDTWYVTKIDGQEISFRLHWIESTNQVGADPRYFEFSMPCMNAGFAFGTAGADLLFAILGAAFPKWAGHNHPEEAHKWLMSALREP